MSIFQNIRANIFNNNNLHAAQIEAYRSALSHYQEFGNSIQYRESLIVMPTGSGKSGVMAILPFELAQKRVLIITPGKIIRKTVFEHFDSVHTPEQTFWIKYNIILDQKKLPKSYLYTGFNHKNEGELELTLEKLNQSDIVVTNVHKIIGSAQEINLLNLVKPDFFDLIIIDEAHHVAANMWKDTINYFSSAKIIKLTATPFRSDNQEISTHKYDPIYEYTLGEAIEDKLLKNVVKEVEIPGHLEFFDTEKKLKYSLEEAKNILGNDFVNRSVAMSEQCSKEVISYTKETLQLKRNSYNNHQVLAITCNDEHAQNVCEWFKQSGMSATYVSTKSLSPNEIERRLNDFSNGVYDVMVSIQLLGEGYDNANISIISIFRPFKTLAPYAQAIGRGLRRIRSSETKLTEIDNYCNVIYHKELGLEKLWDYYKSQESFGEMLKRQKENIYTQISWDFGELGFVESTSSGQKPSDIKEEIFEDEIKILAVNNYSSTGIGEADSFTKNGFDEYREAKESVFEQLQNDIAQKQDSYNKLVIEGALTEQDAQILMDNYLNDSQNKFNEVAATFHDNIMQETLKLDYAVWLNNRIEMFFKSVTIDKNGFELYETHKFPGIDKINNIGYIVKNINISLFNKTKKHLSVYRETDFAHAKSFTLDKIEYFYLQYRKEDMTDDFNES
ncbi:MAG TPA: hypothetical protein DCW76_02095 [Lysinibacillus sp.]|nr:hypothetical protein [Lysinibacillus sp.]